MTLYQVAIVFSKYIRIRTMLSMVKWLIAYRIIEDGYENSVKSKI